MDSDISFPVNHDYVTYAQPSLLFFNEKNTIDCFRINILEDDVEEEPEDFKVVVSGPEIEDEDNDVIETFNREIRVVIVDDTAAGM